MNLKTLILEDAAFYDAQMNELKLNLYVRALNALPLKEIARAMNHYRNEKGRRLMPMPADIKAFLEPSANSKDLARITALRIREAVTKFGWCNSSSAKQYIGSAGWRTVERFGGWKYLCENLGTKIDETTFIAQARDTIESEINLSDSGFNTAQPVIEQRTKPKNELTSAKDILTGLLQGSRKTEQEGA